MKNKYHVNISFKWFDFWIGLFFDKPAQSLYICLLPMLPIKIWITKHLPCPVCGTLMDKTAADVGDAWALYWDCPECEEATEDIDWDMDFKGENWLSPDDLRHFGYFVD